ncbi:MAG TPA: redoxin domain-containing protein, partial [Polyangiaceae bacterium]|nr:redoxin domain-containing protein [Polyangiaceae bacterium]
MNAIGSEQGPRRRKQSGGSRGAIPALLCALVSCNSSHKAPTPVSSGAHSAPPAAVAAASHLLGIGDPAPPVAVSVHTGMMARLPDLGPKSVAVFFCPSITAAGCTAPLLALRDNWLKLRPVLGMVIAILGEDRTVLREYAYAQELPFLLSSGAGGALAK